VEKLIPSTFPTGCVPLISDTKHQIGINAAKSPQTMIPAMAQCPTQTIARIAQWVLDDSAASEANETTIPAMMELSSTAKPAPKKL